MKRSLMKKSRPGLIKTAIISVLNCPCGQTIHTPSSERWSVIRRLMEEFGEQPEAIEEIHEMN